MIDPTIEPRIRAAIHEAIGRGYYIVRRSTVNPHVRTCCALGAVGIAHGLRATDPDGGDDYLDLNEVGRFLNIRCGAFLRGFDHGVGHEKTDDDSALRELGARLAEEFVGSSPETLVNDASR